MCEVPPNCELGGQIGAEVQTTVNLPNFDIPVILANVTFFCGVAPGETTLLVFISIPEPMGPIHGMNITDAELSAEATYWGPTPEDGKRWTFIGSIQGTVVTADAESEDQISASVTFIFNTKTGDIELTVEVSLDWDNFQMDLVMQIATGENCDMVDGSYIRGGFDLVLSENSTASENSTDSYERLLTGSIFGAVHCDGHHYVALMHDDIEAVEIGVKTMNMIDRRRFVRGDSGIGHDSASLAFAKDLISASKAALPSYPKYQLKAAVVGEVAPGFTVRGSFALYSVGSTIVPPGEETTKPITEQKHWIGEIYGKLEVGPPNGPGEMPADGVAARVSL